MAGTLAGNVCSIYVHTRFYLIAKADSLADSAWVLCAWEREFNSPLDHYFDLEVILSQPLGTPGSSTA